MEYQNHHIENLQSKFNFFDSKNRDYTFMERLNYGLKIALSFTIAPILLQTGLIEIQTDSLAGGIMTATSAILFLYGSHTIYRFFNWRTHDRK